ncbi:AMP-binding protein [Xenorhabdus khoisanae]|uniref:AMP-binding protein n=1 Tax=Xenorhabdus khoisanae TaxID=880157 RepID=UPI002358BE3F|nr:AMP-binding protein [Xenorhabdus khoisanae]MDC9615914.1 AMP-binding protein [Xenorhabdus khoisanae]
MKYLKETTSIKYRNRVYKHNELNDIMNFLEKSLESILDKKLRILIIDDNSIGGCLIYFFLFFNKYNTLAVSPKVYKENKIEILKNYDYNIIINCGFLLNCESYEHLINYHKIMIGDNDIIIYKRKAKFHEGKFDGTASFMSSGSTGKPKLITHTHKSTLLFILHSIDIMGINERTRHVVCASIGWDIWLLEVFAVLLKGGYIVLYDREYVSNSIFLDKIIEYDSINSLQLTQTQFNSLFINSISLFNLRTIILTGEPCFEVDYRNKLSGEVKIYNVYGSSEMHNVLYSVNDVTSFSIDGSAFDTTYPNVRLLFNDYNMLSVISKYNAFSFLNELGAIDSNDHLISDGDFLYYSGRNGCYLKLEEIKVINKVKQQLFNVMSDNNTYYRNEVFMKDKIIYIFIEGESKDFICGEIESYGYNHMIFFNNKFPVNANGKVIIDFLYNKLPE